MALWPRLAMYTESCKVRATEQEKKSVKARNWERVRRMVVWYITNVVRGLRCVYKRNVGPGEAGKFFLEEPVDRREERRDEKTRGLRSSWKLRWTSVEVRFRPVSYWENPQEVGLRFWQTGRRTSWKIWKLLLLYCNKIIPGCPSFHLPEKKERPWIQ